jgi:hypothetical protein
MFLANPETTAMYRVTFVAMIGIGLAPLAGPAAPRLKDSETPQAYFPTTVGSKWVYTTNGKEHVEVVTAVERKDGVTTVTVEYERAGGNRPIQTIEVRPDGLYMTYEVGKAYETPVCMLKLPVKIGESWTVRTNRPDIGALRFDREVIEETDVETPAGRFRAVRVRGRTDIGNQGRVQSDYWYAPEVGLVKLDERVLQSFTPGKR